MRLEDATVVTLVAEGYEEIEFWYPVLRCREAGAHVTVLGIAGSDICSGRCSYPVAPDLALGDYEGTPALVVVPSFIDYPPDELRSRTSGSLRSWYEGGAYLMAMSSGVGTLALADLVRGSTVACDPAVADLVVAAGGEVSDQAVVVTGQLATARSVGDIADLFRALLSLRAGLA
jgi:protease I